MELNYTVLPRLRNRSKLLSNSSILIFHKFRWKINTCAPHKVSYTLRSFRAFCSVTYERVNMNFGNSETKLAVIKALIIPRLELQMATVSTRLKSKISEEIEEDIQHIHILQVCWNRLKHSLRSIRNPGTMNVAADCMRGQEIHKLNQRCSWISGPEFLLLS